MTTAGRVRSRFFVTFVSLSFLAVGCARPGRDAAAAPHGPAAEPQSKTASKAGSGTGHVHLVGGFTFDQDFGVSGCMVGPPGDGLLSGYRMTVDGDKAIELLTVTLKDYVKDGSYSPMDKTAEGQVNAAMSTGVMGPLTLMVSQGEGKTPLAVMLKPESKMTIAVSGEGARGDIEFTDMETPVTFADIDPSSKAPPHGRKISGSVTWSCGVVERLDPKMNDAVNGAFKKLVPGP